MTSDRRRRLNTSFEFPKGFLWGTATAAHQVEGNNLNSDVWLIEQVRDSPHKQHFSM